jgi:ParB-like chromosome segregation protein Spo0J
MAKAPAMKIVPRKVADLVPYAKNAREHSEEQLGQIAESIKRFGFTIPVLVDESLGIIAGHGRVEAAKRLGMVDVPTILAAGWSDEQKRAYVIADNKIGLNSDWNLDILKGELVALSEVGADLATLGFSALELSDLMAIEPAPETPRRSGLGKPVIQFNIVFDDEQQQQAWFNFVRKLKADYPDAETLGERLALFIEAQNGAL